jgi:hypothetical protein
MAADDSNQPKAKVKEDVRNSLDSFLAATPTK